MASNQDQPNGRSQSHAPTTQTGWNNWLRDNAGITDHNLDATTSSAEAHARGQLEFLLDGLERLWNGYPHIVNSRPDLKNVLDSMPVLCHGGQRRPLWETYLPTEALRKRCAEFLAPHESFPFLDFGYQPADEELEQRWHFLVDKFGVSVREDVGFFLDLISFISDSNPHGLSPERCRDMARLYATIEQMCAAHPESESMRDICRCYLQDIKGIAIPSILGLDPSWARPRDCLANVSICTFAKPSLEYIYTSLLDTDDKPQNAQQLAAVMNFFHKTVAVPNVKWQDYVRDLVFLVDNVCTEITRYGRIYAALDKVCSSDVVDEIRDIFQTYALIYVPNAKPPWQKSTQCIWSSTSQLSASHPLEPHYPKLQSCFSRLGVSTLSLATGYNRLLALGDGPNARPDEVKAALLGFNALLSSNTIQLPDPLPFLKSNLFPVTGKNKHASLVSASTDFAIPDRRYLASRFAGKAVLLDFSPDEVHRLKPLLQWSGLENRYLSTVIREVTFVSGGPTFPLAIPKLEVAPKAQALLRIANALNSPRCGDEQGLMRQLQSIKVVETDGISCRQYLVQNGNHIEAQTAQTDLHLEDRDGLNIHVPHDPVSQEVCFASVLPKRLLNWLMDVSSSSAHVPGSVPNAAVEVMASILNHDVSASDRILELQGIE